MTGKYFSGLAATVLSIGISSSVLAEKDWWNMNLQERRAYFKPEPTRVQSCPVENDTFWSHWATERGYENLFQGNFKDAAICYEKAGEMYKRGVAAENRDNCFVCDSYERMGAILWKIPKDAVDIRKETFEESANKAVQNGNKKLAAKLYELTAIGYADLDIEGYYGRFENIGPLHAEKYSWKDSDAKARYFFEKAAELVSDSQERRRLLRQARVVQNRTLERGSCYGALCQTAKAEVTRLDSLLK